MSATPAPALLPASETDTATSPLRARLRAALPDAMRRRDRVAVAVLRSALGALDNAEAVEAPDAPARHHGIRQLPVGAGATEAPRRELTEDQITAVVRAEADERLAAADAYAAGGHHEHAERLRAEAAVLGAHLAAGSAG